MQTIRNIFSKTPSSSPRKAPTTSRSKAPTDSPIKQPGNGAVKIIFDDEPAEASSASKSPWDADDEEFDPRVWGDLRRSSTKTLRASPLKSACGSPMLTPSPSRKSVHTGKMSPTKGIVASSADLLFANAGSAWDADDSEFDSNVYIDLKESVATFKSTCNTFRRLANYQASQDRPVYSPRTSMYHFDSTIGHNLGSLRTSCRNNTIIYSPPTIDHDDDSSSLSKHEQDEARRNEESYCDMVAELNDPTCGNPTGSDLHDNMIANIYTDNYPNLPPCYPARHMHVLNWISLEEPGDIALFLHAHPRLCDAVATVLFELGAEVLGAFLDPHRKVFEWWRRTAATSRSPSILIRRDGQEVLVGVFRNHGFKYVWGYHVKSIIDFTGKWTETFASTAMASTNMTNHGPLWNSLEHSDSLPEDVDPKDPIYALYIGRKLGRWLLRDRPWDYNYNLEARGECEWASDGKTTRLLTRDAVLESLSGRSADD